MHSISQLKYGVLALLLAQTVANVAYADTITPPVSSLRIGGSGTDLATIRLLAAEFMKTHPRIRIEVPTSIGSSGAVKALEAGWLDIGLTSRPLKKQELDKDIRAIQYARTPLVFAVARDNPASSVTLKQLAVFFSGKRTHWDNGKVVRVVLRLPSDSDSLLMRSKSALLRTALDKAYQRRGVPIAATDQDSADNIVAIPDALGTTTLALILAENRPLKPLQLNGVIPSPSTIADGSYPFAKELFLLLPEKASATARDFLKYLGSPQGAQILQRTGHQIIAFDLEAL